MNILWEDRFLILAEKPVGTLSQPAPGGGGDMLSLLAKARAEKGEEAVVYPVHRLDRGVGGVMVFAKDSKTAGKLSALLQQNALCKEYRAVVHGIPEAPEGTFRDLLFRDAGRGKTFVVQRERRGVREAELSYRLLGTVGEGEEALSLVAVTLHTGRTHQVRVQFASRKMPLWGDGKYGARDHGAEIALWSTRLTFPHPITGAEITGTLPPPQEEPWSLFPSEI